MPWTPLFEASQEEALVDNVMTIITRDFKLALDQRYPIEAVLPATDPRHLRDFQERGLGQILGNDFPSLAVGPNRGTSNDGPNGECLRENILIDIHIGVLDDSPTTVTQRIMRYRATMDSVIRSAPITDYLRNMSTESFAFVQSEINYFYRTIEEKQSGIFRAALLRVVIDINER